MRVIYRLCAPEPTLSILSNNKVTDVLAPALETKVGGVLFALCALQKIDASKLDYLFDITSADSSYQTARRIRQDITGKIQNPEIARVFSTNVTSKNAGIFLRCESEVDAFNLVDENHSEKRDVAINNLNACNSSLLWIKEFKKWISMRGDFKKKAFHELSDTLDMRDRFTKLIINWVNESVDTDFGVGLIYCDIDGFSSILVRGNVIEIEDTIREIYNKLSFNLDKMKQRGEFKKVACVRWGYDSFLIVIVTLKGLDADVLQEDISRMMSLKFEDRLGLWATSTCSFVTAEEGHVLQDIASAIYSCTQAKKNRQPLVIVTNTNQSSFGAMVWELKAPDNWGSKAAVTKVVMSRSEAEDYISKSGT